MVLFISHTVGLTVTYITDLLCSAALRARVCEFVELFLFRVCVEVIFLQNKFSFSFCIVCISVCVKEKG